MNQAIMSKLTLDEEPISNIEFQKAVDLIGLSVFSETAIELFTKSIDNLIKKGESSYLTPDEVDAIEKGKKDMAKLVKKKITDKNGKTKTVYVKASDAPAGDKKEGGSSNEEHASNTKDAKLEKYLKEGKDEDLKKIAKEELNKRKSEASKAKYAAAQKGGVIGKTKSGKDVHSDAKDNDERYSKFTYQDHTDAAKIHEDIGLSKRNTGGDKFHEEMAMEHRGTANKLKKESKGKKNNSISKLHTTKAEIDKAKRAYQEAKSAYKDASDYKSKDYNSDAYQASADLANAAEDVYNDLKSGNDSANSNKKYNSALNKYNRIIKESKGKDDKLGDKKDGATSFLDLPKNTQSAIAHNSYRGNDLDSDIKETVMDMTDEEYKSAEKFYKENDVRSKVTSDEDEDAESLDDAYKERMEKRGFTVAQYEWGDGDNTIINVAYRPKKSKSKKSSKTEKGYDPELQKAFSNLNIK